MIRQKQRWKVHQCEFCQRWRSDGQMIAAGEGRRRYYKFVCRECQRSGENQRILDQALRRRELERRR